MAEIRHFINGQDLGEPRNWQDLEITVDWLNKTESGAINVSDLAFVREANEYLQKRIMNGLNGGVGLFEGEPYEIVVGDIQNPKFRFEGYLDFTEDLTSIGGQEIICSLKRKKGEDWLNDVADSFSYASLYDEGIISDSDFVRVPYVINFIPDGLQIIMLSMSIYMMTKELIENIQALADSIADLVDAATPVIGVGVGFGAVAVTAWDIGNFILATLKTIARIAYMIAMVAAIIELVDALFTELLPAKRYHLGMTFRKLLEKGCEKLGLQFSSSIQELNWTHIPRKSNKGGEKDSDGLEVGYPSNTGPIYLFGDSIRILKEAFNADFRISNGVFYFERKDSFKFPSSYQVPSFFNNQERLHQQFKLNTDEMVSNYNIFWQLDSQDQNTLVNNEGRVFQAITEPIAVNNPEFVNIKNLVQVSLPFSVGLEKRELTTVEEVAKTLASIVDGITGVFGGGTNYASQIRNRIGSLLLSSHYLTFGKVVVMNGQNLANNQRELVSATALYNKYHFINSFAEINGVHNQYFRYLEQQVPMSLEEFCLLLENNLTRDSEGNEIVIEKVIYNPYDTKAIIDYRVRKKYTNNLTIKYV